MARKTVRASELRLSTAVQTAVARSLAPVEAWAAIEMPEAYLESRIGKYVAGLEMLLKVAVEENDIDRSRGILNDLLRLTKMGRAKADINVVGITKLRNEHDLRQAPLDLLKQIVGIQE